MNLIKMAKEMLGPGIIMNTLENQDPKVSGGDVGKIVRDAITNELGIKGYAKMQPRLVAWLDGFYLAMRKKLMGN